ncbi:uncharacterized protein PFL1_01263 [Pseudozyma flocculosa PF-1]|uniref:Related to KRE2 - alpha-1,2-mannosyltransferase n=1 Tax=Pseudozyma flocculosa TaxID=84751 RepID=A0A5C3EX03_9BASI|nr:uncharacterized protein PFL1_01263 [Pseudozyma flocculosa PF-1]EPQ31074.1 hypothetical protein PFL1_01263 [Pseudozyma flocculosa PF-1]SPO35927.1 related to KRE2 - alpha-1,2-mannosyltransferase [Pseudozyma flocculosa]
MIRPLRYIALALSLLLSLHYLATLTSPSYSSATSSSLQSLRTKWKPAPAPVPHPVVVDTSTGDTSNVPFDPRKPSAAFVILCRNDDLSKMLMTLQTLESTFNSKPHNRYPYVFLNDDEFSQRFRTRIRAAIPADVKVEFGRVEGEAWGMPSWIDRPKAEASWKKASHGGMPYGGSESYRNMCRFQSGYFFRHPLVLPYRYYWRVEPDVRFLCDLEDFDPFRYMRDHGKKYGYVLSLHEIRSTVKTLWVHVRKWYQQNPQYLHDNNAINFITDRKEMGYSMCHFWSNFEIADMELWRSEAYLSFFEYLDKQGGFYYERWGDAPVHSIAAALMLDKNEIHYFDNVGYMHAPFLHCPKDPPEKQNRCWCTHETSLIYDDNHWSCRYDWDAIFGKDPERERARFNELTP